MQILEFGMLFCFGFSWPFSIAKSLKTRQVQGKSLLFMILIIVGYLFGIVNKLFFHGDDPIGWVTWVYFIDLALVSTDLALYFRYLPRSR